MLTRMLGCVALAVLTTLSSSALAQEHPHQIAARDLATLRDIDGLNVSPDRQYAAFSVTQADPDRNAYDIAWYVLDIATGSARRVSSGGQLLPFNNQGRTSQYYAPNTSAWSPDSRWIAFLRRDNGHTQIWRARRDGQEGEQLTYSEADVRALRYTRDGARILFQTEPSQAQVEQALVEEGQRGFLYDARFYPVESARPIFPRDSGSNVNTLNTPSQVEARRLWAYDIANHHQRPASEIEQTDYVEQTTRPVPAPRASAAVAAPHGRLAWTEPRDPERQGWAPPTTLLAQQQPGVSNLIPCVAPACANTIIDQILWRDDRELMFVRREGAQRQDRTLYAWMPGGAHAPRLILRTQNTLSECTMALQKLLCISEHPNYPARLVAIDPDTGSVEALYDPNPAFARFDLGPQPQRLAIRTASGVDTYGYLVLPPHRREGERLPLVVVTYTCSGFLRGGDGDEFPIYPFAAQGFAVLCFAAPEDWERAARLDLIAYDNWGHGPGEPAFQQIEDALEAALAQLDRAGVIDPDRVGITGLSFGADVVAFALPRLPHLAAAIATSAGLKGPSLYPYQGPRLRAFNRGRGLIAPKDAAARWRDYALSAHVDTVFAPLLLNVPDREFLASLDGVTALEDAGRAVEMYVFPDEHHVKWQPIHRLAIYNRNLDWMNFWLRGVESNMTGDTSQYTRWRAMREQQCHLFGPGGTEFRADAVPWYCRPGALGQGAH